MTEVTHDTLNVIELTELGVSLDAIGDKILILVDGYKSGYECKVCGGTGKVESSVVAGAMKTCEECKGKGSILVIPDNAKSLPSTGVIVSMGPETKYMIAKQRLKPRQLILEQAEEVFNLSPIGKEELIAIKNELNSFPIQIGSRVVFGAHVGTSIPIKGNIKLKIMREHEPLCRVFGSDIADKEILDYNAEVSF